MGPVWNGAYLNGRAALVSVLLLATGAALTGPASGEPPSPHEPELGPEIEPRGPEVPVERQKVPMKNGMLRIPGGEFAMGFEGPPPGEPNERPIHLVKVAPFWIDRTEVTIEDMHACIGRGDCALRPKKGPDCTFDRPEPKLPINCMPWQAADAYCRAVGKRLPTEAEWEFAASGGQKVRYPWGTYPPSWAPTRREQAPSGSRTWRATSRNGCRIGTLTDTKSSCRSKGRPHRRAPPSASLTCCGAAAG